nr:SUMF1/EgtB/PvdO family nonheme iron enzyme [Leptospira abararensis]
MFDFLLLCKGSSENPLVLIKGGTFVRGRNITDRPDESPKHRVQVGDFYYQETLVTQRQFSEFILASHYKTSAEKKGYCLISYEGMKDWEWEKKKEANYQFPFGLDSKISILEDHPVVCVSYMDAKSYCEFYQMRLPTEAEWEYAARASGKGRYPWGESENLKGKFFSNFWQGDSHLDAKSQDGHKYLSQVKSFPPNKWGIYDPVGNVWQFTNDYYDSQTYLQAYQWEKETGSAITNPKGPSNGRKIVSRGGSWWCSERTCKGHGLYYRGKINPSSPFNNNGFRCVKDLVGSY